MYTSNPLHWSEGAINILGISISYDQYEMVKINYEGIVDKIKGILKACSVRGLSMLGKVIMINSLIGSLFVYKMNVLYTILDGVVDAFNKLLAAYLWDEKKQKVSFEALCSKKEQGGLRLVDLYKKDQVIKIQWVKVYYQYPEIRILASTLID